MFFQRRRIGLSTDCSGLWRAALDPERPSGAAIIGSMSPGVGIALGVAAIAVAVLVSLRLRASKNSRNLGLQLEVAAPARKLSDDEFWGLYWQRRLGIRRETVTVRAKNTNVILIGQIPISPTHSRWVYDLEKSMLDGGLITQPGGKNWLPTDEGKRALEARLDRDEKPLRSLQPLVNAENLQNVDLNSASR
jgi:hypothetical protein